MGLLPIIRAALEALNAYLQLRNKAFYYDLHRESKNRQKQLINEIETLRAKRSSDATERADLLQSELISEKQQLEHISAFYNNLSPGNNGTNG